MDPASYEHFRTAFVARLWTEVGPFASRIEDDGRIPYSELFPILKSLGAFGLLLPHKCGGAGLSMRQYAPLIGEFAKVHGGIRALIHVHNSFAHSLAERADTDPLEPLLRSVAAGDASIAFALTEPDRGTGPDIATTAHREGDELVLNGTKWLITNTAFASHFIVVAKTPSAGAGAASALLVPRAAAGTTITALPETMGCRGGEHGRVDFVDVRVPIDASIGGLGRGFEFVDYALEISRVLVAASALGIAEYALELSTRRARERVTFGKPIAERQAVQRYLAEMAMDVHALRLMVADAAAKWDAGRRIALESSVTKLFALEAVARVTDRALLVYGGIGYTRLHPIERLFRDARLAALEEGTPTIQHLVAARNLEAHRWDDPWS